MRRVKNHTAGTLVNINIITETSDYWRVLSPAWDKEVLARTEAEIQKLPAELKDANIQYLHIAPQLTCFETKASVDRSGFHKSSKDVIEHLTFEIWDSEGNFIDMRHAAKDPAEQEQSGKRCSPYSSKTKSWPYTVDNNRTQAKGSTYDWSVKCMKLVHHTGLLLCGDTLGPCPELCFEPRTFRSLWLVNSFK